MNAKRNRLLMTVFSVALLGAVLNGTATPTSAAIDHNRILTGYYTRCVPGPDGIYVEEDCVKWFKSLSSAERDYAVSLFRNDGVSTTARGKTGIIYPKYFGRTERGSFIYGSIYKYYRGSVMCLPTTDRCWLEIHWLMHITHYWCDNGVKITGCLQSQFKSQGFWDEKDGRRVRTRINEPSRYWTQLYTSTRYERRVGLVIRQYCDPEVTLRVEPEPGLKSYYWALNDPDRGQETHENCHLSL